MKTKKVIISVVVVIVALVVIALCGIMFLRATPEKAEQAAISAVGGGEIVEREISSDGLLNEYSYTIVNGNTWYEVEINGFGSVEELKQGTGDGWKY
jgi:hypothetical protein